MTKFNKKKYIDYTTLIVLTLLYVSTIFCIYAYINKSKEEAVQQLDLFITETLDYYEASDNIVGEFIFTVIDESLYNADIQFVDSIKNNFKPFLIQTLINYYNNNELSFKLLAPVIDQIISGEYNIITLFNTFLSNSVEYYLQSLDFEHNYITYFIDYIYTDIDNKPKYSDSYTDYYYATLLHYFTLYTEQYLQSQDYDSHLLNEFIDFLYSDTSMQLYDIIIEETPNNFSEFQNIIIHYTLDSIEYYLQSTQFETELINVSVDILFSEQIETYFVDNVDNLSTEQLITDLQQLFITSIKNYLLNKHYEHKVVENFVDFMITDDYAYIKDISYIAIVNGFDVAVDNLYNDFIQYSKDYFISNSNEIENYVKIQTEKVITNMFDKLEQSLLDFLYSAISSDSE